MYVPVAIDLTENERNAVFSGKRFYNSRDPQTHLLATASQPLTSCANFGKKISVAKTAALWRSCLEGGRRRGPEKAEEGEAWRYTLKRKAI